jgi:hypothetical protein
MLIVFSERFHRSVDWILPGEGKSSRPASGRCAPWLVTGREEGFNRNRNQPNYLSTMEPGKVEIGAEALVPISREFGKSIEWLRVGGIAFYGWRLSLIGSLLHPADSDTGDTMMLSLYVTLGVFLLIAVRNPSAHRRVIAFTAWSSFAHAVAMSILGLEIPSQKVGFLVGSAVLVVIGVALIALNPAKPSVERISVAVL